MIEICTNKEVETGDQGNHHKRKGYIDRCLKKEKALRQDMDENEQEA